MIYIYTAECCPKCIELKDKYKAEGIQFEERSADRIKNPIDLIDKEALIQACMQNNILPVEVNTEDGEILWELDIKGESNVSS